MTSSFRQFLEFKDIFGFEKPKDNPASHDLFHSKPINGFDVELAMTLLSKKRIGYLLPESDCITEVTWGSQPGAVKITIDTGCTFGIDRLGIDRLGNRRWVTKKLLQLNRLGYGGYEETVVEDLYNAAQEATQGPLDGPVNYKYEGLEDLTYAIYDKVRNIKNIFIPQGVKRLDENAYIICFGVRAQGLQAAGQKRIEQNQTMVSYDETAGTIRIFNYNIESPLGRHSWEIQPSDLDVYFFPTQDIEEITEAMAVHFKYY